METSYSACSATACRNEHPCFFNSVTREELLDINCKLKSLIHRCECSSARSRSDAASLCHQEEIGTGKEVTPEEMSQVLSEIEASVQTLRQDYNAHAGLHKMRAHRGRARDSGYQSWRQSGPTPTISEEEVQPGNRQPSEHKEEATNL